MLDRSFPPEMAVTPVSVNLVDVSPAPTTHAVGYFILNCVDSNSFSPEKCIPKKMKTVKILQ